MAGTIEGNNLCASQDVSFQIELYLTKYENLPFLIVFSIKGATDRQLRTCMLLYCVTEMHESGQGQLGVSTRQMSVLQNISSGFKDALTAEYADEILSKTNCSKEVLFPPFQFVKVHNAVLKRNDSVPTQTIAYLFTNVTNVVNSYIYVQI